MERLRPHIFPKHIHIIFSDIQINGVVTVGPFQIITELEVQYLRSLAQKPVVRFGSGQSGAVDSGLLSGANADRLSAFYITYGIRLCIF